MKKLMTFAAVAAMAYVGSANMFNPTDCKDCGVLGEDSVCDVAVFKVTGSGKAVLDKGSYKTVGSIKIKKGALALDGTFCEATAACCYDAGWFYATIKAGKKTFALATPVTVDVWNLFGKKLEKADNYLTSIKPGKKVTLESALFITAEADSALWDGDVDLETFAFWASAFGKVDVKVTKEGKGGYCAKAEGCDAIYTPKKYSGWFVGWYTCVNVAECFKCDCPELDVFGGTWKASYQEKKTSHSAAMGLAGISARLIEAE